MTLTRLRRLARADRLIEQQQALIDAQEKMIDALNQENRHIKIDHMRTLQGLASSWLIHMEMPEVDMREEISGLERTLADSLARLEEHVL